MLLKFKKMINKLFCNLSFAGQYTLEQNGWSFVSLCGVHFEKIRKKSCQFRIFAYDYSIICILT